MVARTIRDALPVTSIVRVLADNDRSRDVKKVEVLFGKGCWEETLDDMRFYVSAPSFFQVNTTQAEKLIELVCEGLDITQGMRVADLYSGVGTFSVPFARAGAKVVSVECAPSSARDLRRNADSMGLDIEVVCADAENEVESLGALDAVLLDPPASGLTRQVIRAVAAATPRRVAYVSCDPQTWARDVEIFETCGMHLMRVVPVDMFPQTYHIELVSFFEP